MLDGVQWSTFPILTVRSVEAGPVIGEIFGHTNRLGSEFLQVQPVGYMLTTYGCLIKLGYILLYIYSSKLIGHFPAVLNFNQLFLKLHQFICN